MKLFNMETYFTANVCIGMLLFSIVASVTSRGIHEDMTRAELLQTFDVTENLPEYEIVPIHYSHVNKRAIDGQVSLHLKPFGKKISLWLEPAEGVLFSDETSVYTLSHSSKGRKYIKHKDKIRNYSPYLYTNLKTYTTLAVSRSSNYGKRMVGMIGSENLMIRPMPERFYTSLKYSRLINEIPESKQNDHHYHIVYRSAINNTLGRFKSSMRMKRAIQNTVYPEILVIVDSSLYNVFGRKMIDMILYLMAFWNGVDMMFRPLESPKFRLNIAAIILVEDDNTLDYISSNQIGSDELHYKNALNESRNWLYEYLPSSIDKNSYDIAVTMTRLDFCDVTNNLKQCRVTLGVTYKSSACKIDENLHAISKTSIIHDNGGFHGIVPTGHELGHLFGADHDGEKIGRACSPTIGNIMKPKVSFTKNAADWSKCSLIAFGSFLKDKGKCLYNLPKHSGKLPRLLPGKMKDAHKQCEYRQGTKSYTVDETICQKLLCYKKGNRLVLISSGAAVDGTPCGDKKMCLHNRCILESLVMQS